MMKFLMKLWNREAIVGAGLILAMFLMFQFF
jgi:hypothetical protein